VWGARETESRERESDNDDPHPCCP
jgi:hypothetical protein